MLRKLQSLLDEADTLSSQNEIRAAVLALLRITLQHACIGLAEWLVRQRTNIPLQGRETTTSSLERLYQPTDGTLIESLGEILIACENFGWNGIGSRYWSQVPSTAKCLRLRQEKRGNIEDVLRDFTTIRNDGVEGHGIPGNYDSQAELDMIQRLLDSVAHILPEMTESNQLLLKAPVGPEFQIELLHSVDGNLVCYRKITPSNGGKCVVHAQVQTGLLTRCNATYEAYNALAESSARLYQCYQPLKTFDPKWVPLAIIPDRLTMQFTGRSQELRELGDWFDDSDSRACLLFGDGGIGKTTVAVEFVHSVIEGHVNTKWRPALITFYSAKLTRWGINGLERIRSVKAQTSEIAYQIVRGLEQTELDRSWFGRPENVRQKLISYLRDWGIGRDDHLLVLDNTETLASTTDDVRVLATEIREFSRSVGRVLLTSRRREPVEARYIEISPFTSDESVQFLKKRAIALDKQPIIQAGVPTLRNYANKLGNKPLLLEVFLQAVGHKNDGLSHAFDRVTRMQRQDLGEFLYLDAWNRMTLQMRHLLLLMTRITESHDKFLLKLCCMQAGVSILEAFDAFEESRGIATIAQVGGSPQITFTPEFVAYCRDRTVTVEGAKHPNEREVQKTQHRYQEFLRSHTAKISDRVMRAYRHHLARAAWLAYQEKRIEDCELFYEEATLEDSENGWLFDRFAYFLFSQRRFTDALEKSITATQLIADDPEAWFTRGMIESRLGMTTNALTSLGRAEANHKARHLCLLQRVYAYMNDTPPNKALARASISDCRGAIPNTDPYRWKTLEELAKLELSAQS